MSKHQLLLLIPLLLTACINHNTSQKLTVDQNLIQQANNFGQFIVKNDHIGLVNLMYPQWVESTGKEENLKKLESNFVRLKDLKISIDSVVSYKSYELLEKKNRLRTTLTQKIYAHEQNGKKITQKQALIAISEDYGKQWNFIPITDNNDLEKLKKKLPNLNDTLLLEASMLLGNYQNIKNTPLNNFEFFWKDFEEHYPLFCLNKINWDSIYSVYHTSIISDSSDQNLFKAIQSCLFALKDGHSNMLSSPFNDSTYRSRQLQNFQKNYLPFNNLYKYISHFTNVNQSIKYGILKKFNIGYIYIGSFQENIKDYYFIDLCLRKFKHTKGLIIDIRENGGGNENYGKIIASRFTNQTVTYRYARLRNGQSIRDLTGFIPMKLYSAKRKIYAQPVVLLTSRRTFSAAEDFTLMMKSLPNVTQLGDTTFGGVGTNPIIRTLPNGWKYRISRNINYNQHKQPIINGIAPQIPVQISKEDGQRGIDTILEKAIEMIAND